MGKQAETENTPWHSTPAYRRGRRGGRKEGREEEGGMEEEQ